MTPPPPPPPGPVGARRRARECALQVLYALDMNPGATPAQALAWFWRSDEGAAEPPEPDVVAFCARLVEGARERQAEIDAAIQAASKNWRLERMARVDRNILRLAVYELKSSEGTPARVVINEAIELAKRFGTAESPAFVNGLLDRISQDSGATSV